MKLAKKIISLLICFAFVFSFSLAFANEEKAADNNDDVLLAQYKGLFQSLGIELESENTSVTRGQFIKNLISMMGFINFYSETQTFSDVAPDDSDLFSAVEYAVGVGMVSPDTNFNPKNEITYGEACKMTVEALGYGRDAKARGGYPYGYFSLATALDLDDGIDTNAPFSADSMYILLGNAANTDVKTVSSCSVDGEFVTYTLDVAEPFLEVYRDIIRIEGIITAANSGYLYDSTQTLDSGKVMIDDVEYCVQKGVICPLGYWTNAYAEKKDGKYVIIYSDISDNDVIEISSSMISGCTDNEIRYSDESERERNIKISSDTVVLYNGKAFEDFKMSDALICDGYIDAIDNDGNGRIDVVALWESAFLSVDYVNLYSNEYDYVFYDKNRKNNIFIDSDTNYISNVDLSSIGSGSVVEAFVSKDGKFVKINLLTDVVSGIIEEKEDGEKQSICIDGKKYELTSYFEEFCSLLASPGKSISFAVDSFGRAVAVTTGGGSSMKIAYFDKMSEKTSRIDETVKLKLFTEDGEVITPNLAEKITVNGMSKRSSDCKTVLSDIMGGLIKYQLNTKGEIVKINSELDELGTYDSLKDGPDNIKRYSFEGDDSENKIYYKSFGYIVPYFTLNSSTKIFVISTSETKDDERYAMGNLSFLANDEKIPGNSIKAYNVSVFGLAGAVLYKREQSQISLSVTSGSAMVAGFSDALDANGDIAYKITLSSGGQFKSYYIKKDAKFLEALTFTDKGYPFEVGDLIRYAIDAKGVYMLTALKDFDAKTQTLLYKADDNTELHYYFGQIYAAGEGSIAIRNSEGKIIYLPYTIGNMAMLEDDKVLVQPKEKFSTYLQVGDDCCKILIRCRYSSPTQAYIIK